MSHCFRAYRKLLCQCKRQQQQKSGLKTHPPLLRNVRRVDVPIRDVVLECSLHGHRLGSRGVLWGGIRLLRHDAGVWAREIEIQILDR